MDDLTTSKRIGLVLKHFVVAFQLRRLHLFAILLLFFFTEKLRVKNSFLLFLWVCYLVVLNKMIAQQYLDGEFPQILNKVDVVGVQQTTRFY